jgi:carboxymethylenebutenolidase
MSFYRGMICESVTIKRDNGMPVTAYVAKPSGPGPFRAGKDGQAVGW